MELSRLGLYEVFRLLNVILKDTLVLFLLYLSL